MSELWLFLVSIGVLCLALGVLDLMHWSRLRNTNELPKEQMKRKLIRGLSATSAGLIAIALLYFDGLPDDLAVILTVVLVVLGLIVLLLTALTKRKS